MVFLYFLFFFAFSVVFLFACFFSVTSVDDVIVVLV